MQLLFCEIIHFIIGLTIGLAAFYIWRKKELIFLSLIISVFIDLDHFVDYWLYLGYLSFNLREFFDGYYFLASKKFYVPFHAYEYGVIGLILGTIFKKYRPYFFTFAIAILGHLVFDMFSNGVPILNYSLIFRIINGFKF